MIARIKSYPGDTLKANFEAYVQDTLGLSDAEVRAIRANLLP